jgi:hypothetical protein
MLTYADEHTPAYVSITLSPTSQHAALAQTKIKTEAGHKPTKPGERLS